MTDIIDRPIKAGLLPLELRGDIDPASMVLLTVHRITENGMTEAQEAAILAAEVVVADLPFRPAAEVIAELRLILDER